MDQFADYCLFLIFSFCLFVVIANVKQVLTVLSAVVLFDLTITPANGLGILLTLIGGALYATVELREKKETKSRIG